MTDNETGKQPRQQNYPRAPPPFPPPNCPRCYSSNTKFCYYNNYSVSQPRYICKECRRYWTHGGVLRNIPSGGTSRKRARTDHCASSQISKPPPPPPPTSAWRPVDGTFRPQTSMTFNGGGFCYQPYSFMLNRPSCELGGVNTAVNVEYTPQPAPASSLMLPQLAPFNGSVHHQPPTAWAGQNASISSNNFLASYREANHVVSMNEWSELKDPLQSYKPPSP